MTRAQRKQRFIERQARIDALQARRDLTPTERLIGGRIGWHENLETRQCNVGYGTLAKETGCHVRAVIRAVTGLERKGVLRVTRARGGAQNESNNYRLRPETEWPTRDNPTRVVRMSPVTKRHPNP